MKTSSSHGNLRGAGIAVEERAVRGILATTSRFQPKAKAFARSTQRRIDLPSIDLVDSRRIAEWCRELASVFDDYFAGDSMRAPPVLLNAASTELTGRVIVARSGYGTTTNLFAIVETDFPHEVVVRRIGRDIIDGDLQAGLELPVDRTPQSGERFVAFKQVDEHARVSFWGNRHLYVLWDGTPQPFNTLD